MKLIKMTRFWLLKSEPTEFSIADMEMQAKGRWDGIRNYQARNLIKEMNIGDTAFFYHSSCKEPGIYGSIKITSEAYCDPTATDKCSKYFDSRTLKGSNPWASVDVEFLERYTIPLLLAEIKALPLGSCPLTTRGNRLSVIPLNDEQYDTLSKQISILNIS